MYLKAADNNRAETILQFFTEGVAQFGLQSHVQGDTGGEKCWCRSVHVGSSRTWTW